MSDYTLQSRPAKAISSRLMTMKFMQRAAASASQSTSQVQSRHQETQSSKRRKPPDAISPATPPSGYQPLQSAFPDEEQKRQKALERLAEETGETKWVLSALNEEAEVVTRGLRVAKAGYSDIDQDAWTPAAVGRRRFGKFNMELEKCQDSKSKKPSTSGNEESEARKEEEDGKGDSDDPAGTRGIVHAAKEVATKRAKVESFEREEQRRAENAGLARINKKRRRKEVRLNNLSSISEARRASQPKGDGDCFGCGRKGHMKVECPQKGAHSHANGRSRNLVRPK